MDTSCQRGIKSAKLSLYIQLQQKVSNMKVTLVGIDLAKNVFQVCGVNQAGKQVFNRQIRRNKLMITLSQYPDATIAMEACGGSNYWGRTLLSKGFVTRLIPAQHVKPFVKGNKNDRNDAFAICEAAKRPHMRFVQPRTLAQTDMILAHKVCSRRIDARTALVNQIRGLLSEYGIVVAAGINNLKAELPLIIESGDNELTIPARDLFHSLLDEWHSVNEAVQLMEKQIKQQANGSEDASRLMKIRGVAHKISTAAISALGENGSNFSNGRHFSANLGLVPKEHSSGGKQNLGGITKRGSRYLRRLLVQGAWSVIRLAEQSDDRLSVWARGVIERRGKQKAAIAVANKLARIIWAVLSKKSEYDPYYKQAATNA